MSAGYVPVIWFRTKLIYDAVLIAWVAIYILTFVRLVPMLQPASVDVDDAIRRMHAFGSCSFLMLSFILCIGPLARLDKRWLPLLYNRRHFGVITCAVALAHAWYVLGWYFAYSNIDPYVALLASNTSYFQLAGFPFEIFGLMALAILCSLAATSHDFWLAFLKPSLWKGLHMLIYAAYGLIVAHIAFGALQTGKYPALAILTAFSVSAVTGLHLAAAWTTHTQVLEAETAVAEIDWVEAGHVDAIADNRGRTVRLPDGRNTAIFRHDNKLYALDNACAHQAGPLGEGCVIDGILTCPWHGYLCHPG